MNKLFFDLETTGISPYSSEVITGFFQLVNGENIIDTHTFASQVSRWSESAAEIHKISEASMMQMPSKKVAYDNLCLWLLSLPSYEAIVYANPNTELGYMHFDIALLQFELMNHLCVDDLFSQPLKPTKITSVHTLAKEAFKDGLFTPIKNENNRNSFKQTDVYKALFNDSYNAHDAVDDVNAMIRIYNELMRLRETGEITKNQLSLL